MAKVASKKTVDNNAGLLKTIEGIDRKKVVCAEDFGRFIVVLLKDEAIFHTHIGLEVRCKRWVTNLEGKANDASLFMWLANLVDMKHETKGKENLKFPETDTTYADMLDSMIIMTEANLCHPTTAFVDMDEAVKFANERLNWLLTKSKELENTINTAVKEESEEDLKKNFEDGQEAIIAEQVAKELKKDTVQEKQIG